MNILPESESSIRELAQVRFTERWRGLIWRCGIVPIVGRH